VQVKRLLTATSVTCRLGPSLTCFGQSTQTAAAGVPAQPGHMLMLAHAWVQAQAWICRVKCALS
jgi:hypothetical protein